MRRIPLRRRADPSQRDVDYHYIVIDNEDIEESPEAFSWYTDETAGGMSLPIAFDGIPAGSKLNEVKAYFLEKLYRNYAAQVDDELGEAISTFYTELGEYMVEDYNWRRVVVPFGCTYRGKAMNQVLDKKWMEWYPLFFRALDRWLATPRQYTSTRDIGESTSAPYDEEEIARQNLTDSDADSDDVLDENGYSLKDGFIEPDDSFSEESEEEEAEEEQELMSDVARHSESEEETSSDGTKVSTDHYESDATSEAESEGKVGQRGYKIGGFVEEDGGSNAIDSDDYAAGGETNVEMDGDDFNSESSFEQSHSNSSRHSTPVSSRTRSHARSPNVSLTTGAESSEEDSPSSSRTSTPRRRFGRLRRPKKTHAHAAKSDSDVDMDSEMKEISDSDAEDDSPHTSSDTTVPVSSRLRSTAPRSTSDSATVVENRSCSPQKHFTLLQPSDFEDLPQETLAGRTRNQSKPGRANSTPLKHKPSPPVSSRARSGNGPRESPHDSDVVAESSSSRSLAPPSSRTRSRTKQPTRSAAAEQSGRYSTPSSVFDGVVSESSDSEEIVPSSDAECPPITPSPIKGKRKRRSTTVYSSSSGVETEDESLPTRSPLKRSRMRVDSESDVPVLAESPCRKRKVKVMDCVLITPLKR
ncbi:hypothetical protein AAF712_012537 [Marasmius tenuissimus]|uniref:Uncharacterized protein n=1 Tax=Marasmius tenuissimus TaxID=585030 RepID=A0ABR2ZG66_9AGAR